MDQYASLCQILYRSVKPLPKCDRFPIFSEHMLSPFRLSVCNVGDPTQPVEIFGKFFLPFGTLTIR